jgi:NADPH-dependent 2,4-dienoyl-CoA reductase/sulfur reductase-like enzyme
MATKERLIVIGGDAAGMSAASQARRSRSDLEIIVFESTPHTSYSACGIPYCIGGVVDGMESLIVRSPEKFKAKYDIDVRTLHEVVEIDTSLARIKARRVDDGEEFWEPYDQLLIATGGMAFRPDLPGIDARGIYGISTLQSGIELHRAMEAENPGKVVIVGGGYIGLEMAEALLRRGLQVSIVQRRSHVMGTLDPDMGNIISQGLRDMGVSLYLNESVTGFEVHNGRVNGVATGNRTLPADLVILGTGVRPNTALAKAAGIPLGEHGAIRVNMRMQTETEGVWAAGDCAESFHLVSRRPVYIALGTVANKHGRVAGINLGGGYATFPGVVGTAVTKVCDLEVGRTGLNEEEITQLGIECVNAKIEGLTRAGYYPDTGKIMVKLLAEKGSGRLLGGQIVGGEGSAKRIDVVATALHAGFTIEDMINLDLGYAPPFSPVWDPVLIAARVAAKRV